MVAAVSTSFNTKAAQTKATRPPLLPSERGSATATVAAHRLPKSRSVTSRYLSTSSSSSCSSFSSLSSSSSFRSSSSSTSSSSSAASGKRCPSPMVSRTNQPTTPSIAKRSQSAGRRQPATPRPDLLDPRGNGEVSTAQRMLLTSGRSLSVSFQGDSFSTQVNRSKLTPSPTIARRGTPEKRKTTTAATPGRGTGQRENSRPAEQWPRSRHPSSLSRSVDYTDERKKLSGSDNSVVRALQNSRVDNRLGSHGRVMADSASGADKEKADSSAVGSDSVVSDTESVSSGSTVSGAQDGNGRGQGFSGRRIVVPARFLQETNNRLRRQPEPGSPVSKTNGLKTMASGKLVAVLRKFSTDSPVSSPKATVNTRGQLSPMRGLIRPASPSNFATPAASSLVRGMSPSRGTSPSRGLSPSRGMSPSRVRSSLSSNFCNTPSILSFAADAKRGKIGENRVADAHLLRLFYNRLLQWRFANARANDVFSIQRIRAERSLYNAWISISMLYDSVRLKRTEVQLLKQNLKLISILNGQMTYLEEWVTVDRDYSGSLLGAIEALRGSTLRLPVVCGAVANVQSVKDAICSAVDVMQAMASSICLLLSKVGKISPLAAELANVSLKEHDVLEECRDLLSTIAALQVTECSLRTHTVQQQHPWANYLTTQV